jgi:hypothetical protein
MIESMKLNYTDIKLERWDYSKGEAWEEIDLSNATEIHIDSSGIDSYKPHEICNPQVKVRARFRGLGLDECTNLICGEIQGNQRHIDFAYRLSVRGGVLIADAEIVLYEFFGVEEVMATFVLQGHTPWD